MKKMIEFIRSITDFKPEVGLILGSGLGDYANKIENPIVIPYADIPGFPVSLVQGHQNQFVLGECQGKRVIAMQGRFHFYEGIAQSQIAIPVRIMNQLGAHSLIITNAAGGVNVNYKPGDLMLIEDHINLSGGNPLIGKNDDEFGPRFPDMSDVYDQELRDSIKRLAGEQGIPLQEGVYLMMSGPCYETKAEIRMARALGADAVGMSTVPEAMVANHCKMVIVGISCITNMACGVTDQALNHQEVVETAEIAREKFTNLIDMVLEKVFSSK